MLAFQGNRTANTDTYIEMCRYMEEKVIPRSEDPLQWSKKNENTFPLLRKLAKNTLELSQPLFQQRGCFLRQKRQLVRGEIG